VRKLILIATLLFAAPGWVRSAAPAPTKAPRTPSQMYQLALKLASARDNALLRLSGTNRARLAKLATRMLDPAPNRRVGNRTEGKRPKLSLSALMARAASIAVLLKTADAATGEGKHTPLASVMGAAEQEPHRGMAGLLYLNLNARQSQMKEADRARVDKLRDRVLPRSLPYEKINLSKGWNESMTVHKEFWRETLTAYRQNGFTVRSTGRGQAVATRTYQYDNVPPLVVTVNLREGEVDLLRDKNKARVVSVTYDGHAALGGNVSSSILTAPRGRPKFLLACFFMCRGVQSLEEVRRNLGDEAHVITTLDPSTQDTDTKVRFAVYEMIARRQTYAFARKLAGKLTTRYLWPDSPERLELVDADLDGVQDAAGRAPGTVDVLFNVGKRAGYTARKSDMRPHRPSAPVHKLDGDKLMRAVAFANTVLTYHAEENSQPVHSIRKVKDRFTAAGFFTGPAHEVIRLVKRGSKIGVQVNALYSGQSRDSLGALVVYELTSMIAPRGRKATSQEKVLRPFMFASHYVYYQTEYAEIADDVVSTLAKRIGLPSSLDYTKMERIIESDHAGYATNKHIAGLERLIKRSPQ
jgi:hypothetical protein